MRQPIENVTPLRAVEPPLGLYFRPAHNDHRALGDIVASGAPKITGAVISASLVKRQAELRSYLAHQRVDAVLDPMALELATPGGWERDALRELPWAGDQQHDFATMAKRGVEALANPIGEFALTNGFSAVLAPTHFIDGVDDPWWHFDLAAARRLRRELDDGGGADIPIFYRVATSRKTLIDPAQRSSMVRALRDLEIDAVWLCVHPVNKNSGASVLATYLDICGDLAETKVPLVAERAGFLGLSLLGFNAVGGAETGLTVGESFDANRLINPPAKREDENAFSAGPRVYIERLGTFLSRKEAAAFFALKGVKSRFACQRRGCCKSPEDMIANAKRHFVFSRGAQVAHLDSIPAHLRPEQWLDHVRQASDDAAFAARIDGKRFESHQRVLGGWRDMLAKRLEQGDVARSVRSARGARLPRRKSA